LESSSWDVVEAARQLTGQIRQRADEIEQAGQLPDDLVESISDAGLFQMFLPRHVGGPEADPLSAFRVTEHLARADGSVGWCVSISSAISSYLGWLSPEALSEVVGPEPRLRLSGSARPLGVAVPMEGGYRIRGHWDFASNVLHSQWYIGTCIIQDSVNRAGAPKARAVIMPVSSGRVERTWSVLGMRGTGSHDFVVDEAFAPAHLVASQRYALAQPSRLFHPRVAMIVTWSPTAGVALGLARGALDDFAALSGQRSTNSPVPLAQRKDVQAALARAEAIVGSARAFVISAVGEAWEAVAADTPPRELDEAVARARLAITHAMGEAVRAVDLLQRAAGTGGVFTRSGLERRFRDVHTAYQHAAGLPIHLEAAGRVLLGLPAEAPYF
jgi:alkylation response protein AidB-like acyl-CoA dehydrogenase